MELRTTPLVRNNAGRLTQPREIEGRSDQYWHHVRIRNGFADHLRIKVTTANTSCVDEGLVTSATHCVANGMGCEERVSSLIGYKNFHDFIPYDREWRPGVRTNLSAGRITLECCNLRC
jgi:hypothetical protein